MPRKMNDSTADIFDDEEKTYRSAKKARRGTKQECKEHHHHRTDNAGMEPLIVSMAPAAARNQRDSYAGMMKMIPP